MGILQRHTDTVFLYVQRNAARLSELLGEINVEVKLVAVVTRVKRGEVDQIRPAITRLLVELGAHRARHRNLFDGGRLGVNDNLEVVEILLYGKRKRVARKVSDRCTVLHRGNKSQGVILINHRMAMGVFIVALAVGVDLTDAVYFECLVLHSVGGAVNAKDAIFTRLGSRALKSESYHVALKGRRPISQRAQLLAALRASIGDLQRVFTDRDRSVRGAKRLAKIEGDTSKAAHRNARKLGLFVIDRHRIGGDKGRARLKVLNRCIINVSISLFDGGKYGFVAREGSDKAVTEGICADSQHGLLAEKIVVFRGVIRPTSNAIICHLGARDHVVDTAVAVAPSHLGVGILVGSEQGADAHGGGRTGVFVLDPLCLQLIVDLVIVNGCQRVLARIDGGKIFVRRIHREHYRVLDLGRQR